MKTCKKVCNILVNSLGDKHATIRSPKDFSILAYYTDPRDDSQTLPLNSDFINNVINDVSAQFSYQLLANDVGYLKVVGIGPGDIKEQADKIRQGLIELKTKDVKQWILDLRYNGGGNIDPMLSGLAPLLGDGIIGGSVNAKEEITREYKIENDQFLNADRLACEMNQFTDDVSNDKVAILISRYTISSGEFTAIAFKGRANTVFIGEPTAGYTTGNGYDQVTEDIVLVISQDIFMDRNKKIYHKNVTADIASEFQENTELENDQQIQLAMDWFFN